MPSTGGLHVGGAFSAVVPLVATFYGGVLDVDVEHPTRPGQDLFILSKGHAVATLAAIMADLGYFPRDVLRNSRSIESILNGHPGPILPGVPISTGPEGHGLPVAQGFAIAGKNSPQFDVFCLTGDGELRAGMIWEAVLYAGQNGLDNLCLLVDRNFGRLDNSRITAFPMRDVEKWFEGFGWQSRTVDARDYGNVLPALHEFKHGPRNGRPTAIICNSEKGWGGFSEYCISHKTTVSAAMAEYEIARQRARRHEFTQRPAEMMRGLPRKSIDTQIAVAERMNLQLDLAAGTVSPIDRGVVTKPAPPRQKNVSYEEAELPCLKPGVSYQASDVVRDCMKVFSRSGRVTSIDSDLSTTSGLFEGISTWNRATALNVGVAESNMACVGEAYAVLGYNTWVSTFCPFFDWRVMRRIAIGYQERMEAIAEGTWLTEGHNLDLVFLATAPNFETKTNGATHMGNDDALVFGEVGHLRIVDISCPNLLIAFMKWIMEGNRGLVYARMLRGAAPVLYQDVPEFRFGKGYRANAHPGGETAFFVSSGRGVFEASLAGERLEDKGIRVGVIDMPTFDAELFSELLETGHPVVLAEQNNGYLLKAARETLLTGEVVGRVHAINTLDDEGHRRFIHSATYEQLTEQYRLSGDLLARRVYEILTDGV